MSAQGNGTYRTRKVRQPQSWRGKAHQLPAQTPANTVEERRFRAA